MRIVLIVYLLLFFGSPIFADELPLNKGTNPPSTGTPAKGNRAPARPIMCDIDWDAESVTIFGYDTDEILSYEVWDSSRQGCLFFTDSQNEFVAQAKSFKSPIVIVFVFDDFSLIGYLE